MKYQWEKSFKYRVYTYRCPTSWAAMMTPLKLVEASPIPKLKALPRNNGADRQAPLTYATPTITKNVLYQHQISKHFKIIRMYMYSVSSIMAGCLCICIIHIYFLNDVFTRSSFDTFVWVFICVHWWNGHPLPNSSQYIWTEWGDGVPVFDFSACIFSVKRTKFHFNIIFYIIVRLFFHKLSMMIYF